MGRWHRTSTESGQRNPGVVKAVRSTAPDRSIQTRPNFGFDEGPNLRAQHPSERPDGDDGRGYKSKNCSVAWASRSLTRTRESSAVISFSSQRGPEDSKSTCHGRCHRGPGRPGSVLGLASGYMATLVPVHVASFDTRRTSLSPDRLQYWAAWRLSSGRSDVPCMYLSQRCTCVHGPAALAVGCSSPGISPSDGEQPRSFIDLTQNLNTRP